VKSCGLVGFIHLKFAKETKSFGVSLPHRCQGCLRLILQVLRESQVSTVINSKNRRITTGIEGRVLGIGYFPSEILALKSSDLEKFN